MDITKLGYFCAICELGSLTKASGILGISQPALSKTLRAIEAECGQKLVIRSGRGLAITDFGQKLSRKARPLLDEFAKLKNLDFLETDLDVFSIATFEVFSTYFLGFLDHLKADSLKLRLHEVLPGELERCVVDREVDCGITYLPIPHPDVDYLKITEIEMGVFVRKGAFKNTEQPKIPFVVPIMPLRGAPTKVRGLDGWPESAYRRTILHEVTLLESALELCRQGRVAGFFPTFIAREHNLRALPEFHLERKASPYGSRKCTAPVYIVKRKSDLESKRIRQLSRAIRAICK
jgi:DNA-binding transcriptional LysR family regulator